jgi:hypothetical protein
MVQRKQSLEGSVRQVIELRVSRDLWVTSEVVVDGFHQNGRGMGSVRKLLDPCRLPEAFEAIKARRLNDLGWVRLKHLYFLRKAAGGVSCFYPDPVNKPLTINGSAGGKAPQQAGIPEGPRWFFV